MIVEAFKDSLELGLQKPEQVVVSYLLSIAPRRSLSRDIWNWRNAVKSN
jgi:hypothetical protein